MNLQLIEGLSVVGISLLILGVFTSTQKEKSTADISSHGMVKDLGYRTSTDSLDDSVRSGSYANSEDTYTFGGKKKNKTRKNNI
jgi:hypothetical protein